MGNIVIQLIKINHKCQISRCFGLTLLMHHLVGQKTQIIRIPVCPTQFRAIGNLVQVNKARDGLAKISAREK